ncbi:MAG: transglutaminase domain-containing protein [Acidobacteria bacterium]|nr:transglutaminase domain-containing protein [Acidobacteriota bacterium]
MTFAPARYASRTAARLSYARRGRAISTRQWWTWEPRPRGAAKTRRPSAADLGQDGDIQPRHPAIRKKAAEIAAGTKDPAAIVHALLTWVSEYIQFQIRSGILTGPQILEQRTGRCAEYAVLFASLARAAGVPTRIVLGVAHHDGIWGGHMWNEVWLGEWIAVDATSGTRVVDPLHLKLIDSPTVDGALLVPKRILDRLQVEILDFEETGVNPALKTEIRGSTYVNSRFHCRISAPGVSWELTERTEVDVARLLSMKPCASPRGVSPPTTRPARRQSRSRSQCDPDRWQLRLPLCLDRA